jgi:hypothetical protein
MADGARAPTDAAPSGDNLVPSLGGRNAGPSRVTGADARDGTTVTEWEPRFDDGQCALVLGRRFSGKTSLLADLARHGGSDVDLAMGLFPSVSRDGAPPFVPKPFRYVDLAEMAAALQRLPPLQRVEGSERRERIALFVDDAVAAANGDARRTAVDQALRQLRSTIGSRRAYGVRVAVASQVLDAMTSELLRTEADTALLCRGLGLEQVQSVWRLLKRDGALESSLPDFQEAYVEATSEPFGCLVMERGMHGFRLFRYTAAAAVGEAPTLGREAYRAFSRHFALASACVA